MCRDTPSDRPPGLLGHWTSRLQDLSTSYLYSHLRAKCCQISVEYRSGRQDLNLRTLLPHRDRTMDADDVFDRFPARSRLTGAADMILVPIKKRRRPQHCIFVAATSRTKMVSAINKETSRSLALDIAAERILIVLADKSDGLWDQKSPRRPNRATEMLERKI